MSTMKVDSIVSSGGTNTAQINGIIPALASQAEAEAGTDNTKLMTPLRLRNALNATGTAPTYACRAWVNFNGTGTVAIRASGNVSSITDNGTGDYTVNFTTAMPDADYACVASAGEGGDGRLDVSFINTTPRTASLVRFRVYNHGNNTNVDGAQVNVAIFR